MFSALFEIHKTILKMLRCNDFYLWISYVKHLEVLGLLYVGSRRGMWGGRANYDRFMQFYALCLFNGYSCYINKEMLLLWKWKTDLCHWLFFVIFWLDLLQISQMCVLLKYGIRHLLRNLLGYKISKIFIQSPVSWKKWGKKCWHFDCWVLFCLVTA
jgi:hypothetical protein